MRRRQAFLAAMLVLGLAGVTGPAAHPAEAPVKKQVSAQLKFITYNCGWNIGVQFGSVAGATAYEIQFWDGYYGQLIDKVVSVAELKAADAPLRAAKLLPATSNYLGYTGSGSWAPPGSKPCTIDPKSVPGGGEPTEGGRFSKGAKAWAILPPGTKPTKKKEEKVTLAGATLGKSCGDSACNLPVGVPRITVLVMGTKASDGSPVKVKDVSDADGKWSVQVPKGTYTAAPTFDGSSFTDAFEPEKRGGLGAADRVGIDFHACISTPASRRPAAAGHSSAPPVSSKPTECASRYTVTLSARIPQHTLVDPSKVARYNVNPGDKPPLGGYNPSTRWYTIGHNATLRSLLELELEYPQCFTDAEVKELGEKKVKVEWYSWIKGPAVLGEVSVPIMWNRSSRRAVVLTPRTTTVTLTKAFAYRYKEGGAVHEDSCSVPSTVKAVYLPVAGGNDAPGTGGALKDDGEFTVIAAWPVPFDPPGAKLAVESGGVGQKIATLVGGTAGVPYKFYESLPKPGKFAVDFALTYFAAGKLVKGIEAGSALAATAAGENAFLATLPALAEGAHTVHSAYEWLHFFTGSWADLDPVAGGYPIMSAVIRGRFDSKLLHRDPVTKIEIWGATTVGVSAASTRFPDISMTVTRTTDPTHDSRPVAKPELPWPTAVAGEPVATWNPFANLGLKPGLLNDSTARGATYYTSGERAVQHVIDDTSQQPAVVRSIRKHYTLWAGFQAEVAEAPNPSCDKSGRSNNAKTICWTIRDGRP